MSTTLRAESSTPSSASSADGLAPMSTSTAPTVVHCTQLSAMSLLNFPYCWILE